MPRLNIYFISGTYSLSIRYFRRQTFCWIASTSTYLATKRPMGWPLASSTVPWGSGRRIQRSSCSRTSNHRTVTEPNFHVYFCGVPATIQNFTLASTTRWNDALGTTCQFEYRFFSVESKSELPEKTDVRARRTAPHSVSGRMVRLMRDARDAFCVL